MLFRNYKKTVPPQAIQIVKIEFQIQLFQIDMIGLYQCLHRNIVGHIQVVCRDFDGSCKQTKDTIWYFWLTWRSDLFYQCSCMDMFYFHIRRRIPYRLLEYEWVQINTITFNEDRPMHVPLYTRSKKSDPFPQICEYSDQTGHVLVEI